MGTWLLSMSEVVAPIRLAAARSSSGWTDWSWLATMYQDGLVLQATPGALWENKVAAGGLAVAQTIFCSSSGRSPQKHPMPDGFSQTRPSATSIWPKAAVTGNLACSLSEVSVSSGPSAAMYTSPATRSSVPAAVMTAPP